MFHHNQYHTRDDGVKRQEDFISIQRAIRFELARVNSLATIGFDVRGACNVPSMVLLESCFKIAAATLSAIAVEAVTLF